MEVSAGASITAVSAALSAAGAVSSIAVESLSPVSKTAESIAESVTVSPPLSLLLQANEVKAMNVRMERFLTVI
ncbi:MAG: hypothetical protein ACXVEE_17065 [Polyangiales bacterium]